MPAETHFREVDPVKGLIDGERVWRVSAPYRQTYFISKLWGHERYRIVTHDLIVVDEVEGFLAAQAAALELLQ